MDRVIRAKEIILRSPIITLATVSKNGEPRSTPVTAAWDEQSICYWTSFNDAQHSKNISENASVFISLFDPIEPLLEASGVYLKAEAFELSDLDEIAHAIQLVYDRKGKSSRRVDEFLGDTTKRMYKAVPQQCWVSLREDFGTDPVDSRKEITL